MSLLQYLLLHMILISDPRIPQYIKLLPKRNRPLELYPLNYLQQPLIYLVPLPLDPLIKAHLTPPYPGSSTFPSYHFPLPPLPRRPLPRVSRLYHIVGDSPRDLVEHLLGDGLMETLLDALRVGVREGLVELLGETLGDALLMEDFMGVVNQMVDFFLGVF